MSEPLDNSKPTYERGFYDGDTWNELAPYPYSFKRWINGLDEAGLKKWWPKKWAEKFGGLKVGKVYTYNVVKGYEHLVFNSGDRVKLIHTRPELMKHVLVESTDENKSTVGLVHVCSLMLEGELKLAEPKPEPWEICSKCEMETAHENLCQNCGQYFCFSCWDRHDDCEPCSDCGQIHITETCQAQPR